MNEYTLTLPAADTATVTVDLAAGTVAVAAAKGPKSLSTTMTDVQSLTLSLAVGGAVTVTGRKPA